MTLKCEEIKELQEHRAIKHGGWKLAAGVTAHLWFMLCAWALSRYTTTQLEHVTTMSWAHLTGGGVFTISFLLMSSALLHWQRAWLRDYWRRNFVGYVARFVLVDKPVSDALGEWPRLRHDIRTRKEDADDRWQTHRVHAPLGESNVAISLPLGGWFAQSWIRGIDHDQIGRLQGWSVKLRAILDTGAVMVEIRKHNRFWGVNECIVTDIWSVIRHLEEIATTAGSASLSVSDFFHWKEIQLAVTTRERAEYERRMAALFDAIYSATGSPQMLIREFEEKALRRTGNPELDGWVYDWMVEQVRRLVAERDAARGEVDRYKDGFLPAAVKDRDAARQERDAAVTFIKSVVDDVEASSRLVNTLEGLKVLHSLVYWLRSIYFGKEQLPEWEGRYERVHQVITEKEWRARRRHGKKADPAPAA